MQVATGYILHRKPFKESSLLADIYSVELGMIRAVINGVRKQKSRNNAEPFCRYSLSVAGRGELKTVRLNDSALPIPLAMGAPLYSALYVNELMLRAEKRAEGDMQLFAAYEWVLSQLSENQSIAFALRRFELLLLESHGMAVDFLHDGEGVAIEASRDYVYFGGKGFLPNLDNSLHGTISGRSVLEFAAGKASAIDSNALKNLCRTALIPLVGAEPFQARRLFTKQ